LGQSLVAPVRHRGARRRAWRCSRGQSEVEAMEKLRHASLAPTSMVLNADNASRAKQVATKTTTTP
jgi:hypothetical protein